MSEAATPQGEGQLLIRVDPEAAKPQPIYSNHVLATFTPEDFTLHLGWYAIPALTEPPESGIVDVLVTPVARVVVPLNLMRSLIAVLQRQVESYEANFGPIPEHPNKPEWLKAEESAGSPSD